MKRDPPAGRRGAPRLGGTDGAARRFRCGGTTPARPADREISAKLLITVSTVEQHLTRIYWKLQVRRRAELSGRLRMADCVGDAS
ncbi:LuxR C-terminal-related transcriptional regulator [Amycolatopsis sp. lyj-84]|uniref:LuxR C-terminal-related transcriptional regulator n=1 Tax=Amycolatopsis sp. lyj-84 TaxID=2789284 RepID=UPI00397C1AD9